jgi:hypothetical protein
LILRIRFVVSGEGKILQSFRFLFLSNFDECSVSLFVAFVARIRAVDISLGGISIVTISNVGPGTSFLDGFVAVFRSPPR